MAIDRERVMELYNLGYRPYEIADELGEDLRDVNKIIEELSGE